MRSFVLLALLSLMSITAVAQQDTMDTLKGLDFSKSSIKQLQAQKLAMEDLKLLRGIIFGRHGRVLKTAKLRSISKSSRGTNQIPISKTRCSMTSSAAIST